MGALRAGALHHRVDEGGRDEVAAVVPAALAAVREERVDAAVVREAGLSLCTPVVAMDTAPERLELEAAAGAHVEALGPLFALQPAP